MSYAYKIIVKNNDNIICSDTFKTLLEPILSAANILSDLGVIEKLTEGSMIETMNPVTKTKRHKIYKIWHDSPNVEIQIRKLSTGNIDVSTFKSMLNNVKEMYERNSN